MTYDSMDKMIKMGKRPQGLGYGDYSSLMKGAGKEPMDSDEYDDMDEADEKYGKSVESDALSKAMEAYDAIEAAVNDGGNREGVLLAKASSNTISKSEREELSQILAGGGEVLRKSLEEYIDDDDPDSGGLVRANGFLKSLTASIDDSLEAMHDTVSKEGSASRELLRAQGQLTKSMAVIALQTSDRLNDALEIIKSLQGRVDSVERTPVRARARRTVDPRSVVRRPLAKSSIADDTEDNGDKLSKSQILQGLRKLTDEAVSKGDKTSLTEIAFVISKVEAGGGIQRNHYDAAKAALGR